MSLSVRQAAIRLGVSEQEVRRLIGAGELRGQRFDESGPWIVDAQAVNQRIARRPGRGRPWAPAVAWAALWHLSGLEVIWLSRGDLSRLRRRLSQTEPEGLATSTRGRALLEIGRVLPEYLDRVAASDEVVRSGLSAAGDAGADLLSTGTAEVYCTPNVRSTLIARYGIDLTSRPVNVILHVPAGDGLPILTGRDAMPPAVVAVDLLDSTDPRTRRAGHDLAARLLEQARS